MVPFLSVSSHSELLDLSKPSWLYPGTEIFPQRLTPGSFPLVLETTGKYLLVQSQHRLGIPTELIKLC